MADKKVTVNVGTDSCRNYTIYVVDIWGPSLFTPSHLSLSFYSLYLFLPTPIHEISNTWPTVSCSLYHGWRVGTRERERTLL